MEMDGNVTTNPGYPFGWGQMNLTLANVVPSSYKWVYKPIHWLHIMSTRSPGYWSEKPT